ncbi:bifunctional diaminohydroxyphosphoribosylaminopyrimidine deaminase/5-amino-6-(5-phosphoribosylamino)uracil reductase RibD [Jannaschia sp. S6380]|uniref:bifunctional diaminohydroxyphosphoribosylaminopyrimidine deaminase/5-amino-6-(5-phosphoribosylamino)uracil reductase RibD n=1 Tax=Jannaschia sp. S6380 TaxID=2926408 RepID=UPI001FF368E6|nr:bifunctional diaminohydroxyphosphoribosylaminopyrimidine deaminase/5-amino-6-(5-phosphoribosylamino)uracil reductase RibD [Jannaschia sp. S6380]MCK0169321.1 bifunctional diaminohydroxyphosphoribosylaminopyrimidine deaminase/5-amino-6-(5-phosphoribosylamino)uracil reductase RibD [Jannaschia sp. S6380]
MTLPDRRFMDHALTLAARGLGRVWPNPAVGCVIESGGIVLGRGWTADGGRPHAETMALAQAGSTAHGATAYVTLEPCAHHGHTPPCTDALIDAGIARVVIAQRDPDPRVNGRGLARLHAAGIEIVEGMREAAARTLQNGFLTRVTMGRPMVTLKLATTLDGRIATASGESRWITGPAARQHVHGQRAQHDAVMVGAGTARADDPRLTVRGFGQKRADSPQPVRIVLSRRLGLPVPSALTRGGPPVWALHGQDAPAAARDRLQAHGVNLIAVPGDGGRQLDLVAALAELGARGLTRVYCEGGGTMAAGLLSAGLVDRLDCYVAGAAIGAEGIPAIGAMGLSTLAEAPRLQLAETRRLGPDLLHRWIAV